MKAWLYLVLLSVLAVFAAYVLASHDGRVLILIPPWRLDLSLNLAVVLVAVAFVVFYALVRISVWALTFARRQDAAKTAPKEQPIEGQLPRSTSDSQPSTRTDHGV